MCYYTSAFFKDHFVVRIAKEIHSDKQNGNVNKFNTTVNNSTQPQCVLSKRSMVLTIKLNNICLKISYEKNVTLDSCTV